MRANRLARGSILSDNVSVPVGWFQGGLGEEEGRQDLGTFCAKFWMSAQSLSKSAAFSISCYLNIGIL